ncbi:MAG TPA: hypothetical protein VGJ15_05790 [Pirellulales bacterium]
MEWFAKPRVRIALTLLSGGLALGAVPSLSADPARHSSRSVAAETNELSDPARLADASRLSDSDFSADSASSTTISAAPAIATPGDVPLAHDGKPLTPELAALGAKIRKVLATYEPKHLNARDNTCWEIMHGLVAFGPRTQIFRDGPGGTEVNAMGWLSWGGRCQGQPLIVLENDLPHPLYGVGLQGHDGQFLAMMAQWRVRPESPMHIGGKDFTVSDLIEEEKLSCQAGTELTFKLLALSHYLPSDAKWQSRFGEQWDIPRLLKAEIEAPVHGAACGGSHRLEAISWAVKERIKRGEPIDGQYARAAKYISDYQRYTLTNLQNPDGSLSTEWFNYAADRPGDIDRKLQTTGHMLEFLVMSLPDEQLRDPRLLKTIDFLSSLMLANPDKAWSIGPLGHALHAQMVYHERMFNEPALPSTSSPNSAPPTTAAPLTAAATAPTKSKTAVALPMPPAPQIEGRGDKTMSQLQKATAVPSIDASSKNKAKKSDSGANTDGCDDSIANGELRMAMRDKLPIEFPSLIGADSGPDLSIGQPTAPSVSP